MKVIVGAPVSDRAWALPMWFRCLAEQTRPPDGCVFVLRRGTETAEDATEDAMHDGAKDAGLPLRYELDQTPYVPRYQRHEYGLERAYTDFADRRNRLLQLALAQDADVFLSLDTDMMLEDPRSIARLLELLKGAPVSSLLAYMHPDGAASECFNAGLWTTTGCDDPQRAWVRPEVLRRGLFGIDIPMGVVAMTRRVAETCRYRYAERGEDPGFAQDLDRHGFPVLWETGIEARHVMSQEML